MDEQQLQKMLNAVKAPAPDDSKRKQALEAAMAAFDKNSAEDTQGSADAERLTDMSSKNNVRRFTMNKPRYAGPMGAVALCALVAVLGTSFYSHQIGSIVGVTGLTSDQSVKGIDAKNVKMESVSSFIEDGASVAEHNEAFKRENEQKAAGAVKSGLSTPPMSPAEKMADEQSRRQKVENAVNGISNMAAADSVAASAPSPELRIAPTVSGGAGTIGAEPAKQAKAKEAYMAQNAPVVAGRIRAPEGALKKDSASRDDMEMDKVAPAVSMPAAPPVPRPEPVPGQIYATPAPNVMPVAPPVMYDERASIAQAQNTDAFPNFEDNGITTTAADPVSTFSIDVDTSSYSFVRKLINSGTLPPKGAVRLEEMINYFPYNYALPAKNEDPFKPTVAVYTAPWNPEHKLLHIGIKGYDLSEKPKSNLVFLIDTSGSMNEPDKLPLLVSSFKLMLDSLKADDTVSIVTYAGNAGVALPPTKAADKSKIVDVLNRLQSGGSTAGAEGIRTAYDLAAQNFVKDGNNRIILATDGDFNVGISSTEDLKDFIAKKRGQGIFLSVLGFGDGNYQDATMQALAQNGNGNAAYIDNLNEARKVLVDEASSTLFTIAKDVKIQVEFNPATVQEYRLIGYETRHLNREDFNNDKIDAGEVGAGHAVTAIYEITPAGARPVNDPLRYNAKELAVQKAAVTDDAHGNEYAFLKIRYKKPDSDTSTLMTRPITPEDDKKFADLSDDLRFAAAVAGFGQLLRDSKYTNSLTYDQVIEMANNAKGKDELGYRAEFVNLARLAKSESGTAKPEPVESAPRR